MSKQFGNGGANLSQYAFLLRFFSKERPPESYKNLRGRSCYGNDQLTGQTRLPPSKLNSGSLANGRRSRKVVF